MLYHSYITANTNYILPYFYKIKVTDYIIYYKYLKNTTNKICLVKKFTNNHL
jgi:hypothetical protein